MPGSIIECPECGKKYRLPEDTQVSEFDCKSCGAVIPIDHEPPPRRAGRRTRQAPPPKSNMPLILGGVGGVIVLVLAFVLLTGDDDETTGPESSTQPEIVNADTQPVEAVPEKPDPNKPPEPTDYQDADKPLRIELGKLHQSGAPKKPRVKARPDGTVATENWGPYQEALKKWREDTQNFYVGMVEKGLSFLEQFPNSKYEKDVVGLVLMGQFKTGDYEGTIARCEDFLVKYPYMQIPCWQFKGDSLDRLGRYEEAAAAYKTYFDITVGSKAVSAAKKYVQSLIKAGKGSEVPSAAEYVLKTTGRARRAVEAMMRPLEHLGKKLPAVPDARPIFSDSPVNWNDYKGKVTLVVIWSTQYEDAKAAMREANVLAAKVSGDVPFQIVGIVLSENEGDQEIDQWLGQNELSEWPQVVQSGEYWQSPVLQAWGLADQKDKTSFWRPYTTFLLDKTARVKYANVPVGDHMEKLIRAMR